MDATFTVVEVLAAPATGVRHGSPIERAAAVTRSALGDRDVVAKVHGDSLVLASPDPAAALALTARLLDLLRSELGAAFRIGIHHGEAIRRGGEWFGSAIAVASRVSAQAQRGQVIATETVQPFAADEGFDSVDLGLVELRGVVAPVQLFALEHRPATVIEHDPVCGAIVDPDNAVGMLRYRNIERYFCSLACAGAYAADPERFP